MRNLLNNSLNDELFSEWMRINNIISDSKKRVTPKIKEFYKFLLSIKNDMYLENTKCDKLIDKSQEFIDFYEKHKGKIENSTK